MSIMFVAPPFGVAVDASMATMLQAPEESPSEARTDPPVAADSAPATINAMAMLLNDFWTGICQPSTRVFGKCGGIGLRSGHTILNGRYLRRPNLAKSHSNEQRNDDCEVHLQPPVPSSCPTGRSLAGCSLRTRRTRGWRPEAPQCVWPDGQSRRIRRTATEQECSQDAHTRPAPCRREWRVPPVARDPPNRVGNQFVSWWACQPRPGTLRVSINSQ